MTAKLRVAHFTVGRCNPDSANGIDKAVYALSVAQAKLGHPVAVFSLTDKEPVPIPGVAVYTHGRRGTGSSRRFNGYAVRRFAVPEPLFVRLLEWRPDVLHMHSVHIPENIVLAARLRRTGIPYGVSVHGGLSAVIRRRHRWRKLALKLLGERRQLQGAAFLHALTDRDAQGIRGYGLDRSVVVVPNGMLLDDVPDRPDSGRLRRLHPELEGRRVFVFLGRLDPHVKGLDLLLRAFAAARGPSVALAMIGPGRPSHRKEIDRLCRRLGLGGTVVRMGPAYGALKFDLLAGADVFVHPSRSEATLPFALLEAAAMRKPCLVTPAADPDRMLVRYGGGIMVPADAGGLAEGIARFQVMDPARLRRMGEHARRMVEQEFDWGPIAARMIGAYRTFAMGEK